MRTVRSISMLSVLTLSAFPSVGWANLLNTTLNNPSFESPDITFASNEMGAPWQREGPSIYIDNPTTTPNDLFGVGTFDNPVDDPGQPGTQGHLQNADGLQIGYLFSHSLPDQFPVNTDPEALFKDHAASQVTALTYEAGKQYRLTIAFANATSVAPEESKLTFSLFATNSPSATNGPVIASQMIDSSDLNQTSLEDFWIDTPEIAGAAIGQFIGIRISTQTNVTHLSLPFGQYDFDNVRLTLVPEPSTAALLGAGAMGLLTARRRRRR